MPSIEVTVFKCKSCGKSFSAKIHFIEALINIDSKRLEDMNSGKLEKGENYYITHENGICNHRDKYQYDSEFEVK